MSDAREILLELPPGSLHVDLPVGPGLRAGISLAAAGDMALSKAGALPRRSRFLEGRGLAGGRLFTLRQVHSRTVVAVDELAPGDTAVREADGMVARRADSVLTVTVADCLPILLVDRASGAFGIVHSGWKGTGIVGEAIAAMGARFESRAADIAVTIGPGIGACCYRVPEERAVLFAEAHGQGAVVRGDDGTPRLDLRRANVELLRRAGVEDIAVVKNCTCCSPALGSFRRQGARDFTLMLAYITGREQCSPSGA